MKILELCLSYGHGGLELYALKTIKWLNKNSEYKLSVAARKDTMLDSRLAEENIPRDYFRVKFRHFPLFAAWRLAKYLDKKDIDIIHIHWGYDAFLAVLAKVISKKNPKLVYTRQMALTRKKNDIYHRFIYKNIDAYIVITKSLYNDALKYLPLAEARLHLLYYGVPAPASEGIDCQKFLETKNIEIDSFKLAIFGRIEHGKGQHLVVDCVRQLREMGKKITAVMIGHVMDDEYYSRLELEMTKSNINDFVRYIGFHDNPVSIMPCFDAVVLASKCETFGLVLPEAMRAGVAVIGSDCGGVPEIIQHEKTGLLFEPENANNLAVQVKKLIDKKEFCQKIALAGKKEADDVFSEERHFENLSKIFKGA